MSEAHFESAERQADAARLGMWAFLVSEVFLFAGLFTLYGAYRAAWPEAFAEGVRHGAKMLGSLNTVILITSSFAVASSLRALQEDRPRVALRWLLGTLALALGFLAVKAVEYHGHVHEGILPGGHGHHFATLSAPAGQAAFFTLYYVMTGLHALHVVAGAAVLAWLAWRLHTGALDARRAHVLSNGALYWHLVDCVWIVLWPLFYLTGGAGMKRRDVGAFVALLTLTGLSLGASYVPLGAWGMAVALGFAAIKVSVVAVVFMHLARSPRAEALFALGAVVVVAILVLLAAADVMTRT